MRHQASAALNEPAANSRALVFLFLALKRACPAYECNTAHVPYVSRSFAQIAILRAKRFEFKGRCYSKIARLRQINRLKTFLSSLPCLFPLRYGKSIPFYARMHKSVGPRFANKRYAPMRTTPRDFPFCSWPGLGFPIEQPLLQARMTRASVERKERREGRKKEERKGKKKEGKRLDRIENQFQLLSARGGPSARRIPRKPSRGLPSSEFRFAYQAACRRGFVHTGSSPEVQEKNPGRERSVTTATTLPGPNRTNT